MFHLLFLASPTQSNEILRKKIDKAINIISVKGTDLEQSRLSDELNRINIAGGLEKLNSIEGLTFKYKGKVYKWTGLFAAINQVLGILQYKKIIMKNFKKYNDFILFESISGKKIAIFSR